MSGGTVRPPLLGHRRARRSVQAIAGAHGLHRVGRRPSLGRYVVQVWGRREFIWTYAASRVSAVNSRDRLGSLWLVLTPVISGALYYLVFGVLLNTRAGVENFVGYLVIGVFLFQFTGKAVGDGARVVPNSKRLIQALDFPAATLPLSTVLRQALTAAPSIVVMLAICGFATEAELTWRWVLVLPALVLLGTFALGLTLLLARLVARLNDLANLIPFIMRGWLFLSGVFYGPERFAGRGALETVFEANPMYRYLTLVRESVLYSTTPSLQDWGVASAWAVGAFLVGFVAFWQAEEQYSRD